ncbi:vacuolar protein sorting protein 55 [Protomyces lactucae-debilis]|uniref:Vacuolar protein sorting protein 55 n=1 Tax=Protomyces lactucae-debilis TaxID=2754530 RepID=A0A1Y2FQ58_PROLT|nr:vacuolar protein sorting protein 55 [Protomyces lactucae-debilis]ORY85464.1 vacuolar protein sorting protein 55 [Protomyces lactucae-debilis]
MSSMEGTPMLRLIIVLSFVLACGFLLVILSCALWDNWYPLFVVATYLCAPLPNAIAAKVAESDAFGGGGGYGDEGSSAAVDFGKFLTGILLVTGMALPVMLYHTGEINQAAMIMSICGGGLIYGSIIAYTSFFSPREDF